MLSWLTKASCNQIGGCSTALSAPLAVKPQCATSTAERLQSSYWASQTPSPGAGRKAGTGDPTSDLPSQCRPSETQPQISAKPERRGRPAGSRAHFLQLLSQTIQ